MPQIVTIQSDHAFRNASKERRLQESVYLLEDHILLFSRSVDQLITEVAEWYNITNDELKAAWNRMIPVSPQLYWDQVHLENIDDPKKEEAIQLNDLVSKAVVWLKDEIFKKNTPHMEVLEEISKWFGVRTRLIEIIFEAEEGMSIKDYWDQIWNKNSTPLEAGSPKVIEYGHNRTKYIYGKNSSYGDGCSTTYQESSYQKQQKAWEKLEEMANLAKAGKLEHITV